MRRACLPAAVCCLLPAVAMPVLAAPTWCSTNWPDAVMCEDFDRYCCNKINTICSQPPPEPEACNPAQYGIDIRDGFAMEDVWDTNHSCGWSTGLHDEYYTSYPYSCKIGSQPFNNELGYGNRGLGSLIQKKFGNAYTEVAGTDLTPLTLEYVFTGRIANKINGANVYVELGRGRGGPMFTDPTGITNYVQGEDCKLCGATNEHSIFPRLCRQNPAPPGCADPSTAPTTPAIAVGALAFLDPNPCQCGVTTTDHWPKATHLSVFDGRYWWNLPGAFTDPGGTEPATGTFALVTGNNVFHRVRLTIKSTTMIVEMRVGSVLSRCQLPRAYSGPFNSMLIGYQLPCEVQPGTWECNGADDCNGPCGPAKTCCVSGAPDGGTMAIDDVVVHGGQGYAEAGACCFADTTCTQALQGDCALLGGQPGPAGSTCQNHPCCPPLPADHDMDGDVDLADFGWFQTCLSGPEAPTPTVPCQCADYQKDGSVDAIDLGTFLGCMLGPELPADPNCTD